jgi:hypothetical protein
LTLTYEQTVRLLEQMDNEARAIRDESLKISWFMRGGVSYEDAMYMSVQERELIGNIIKKNMETTKESGMPFF